MSRRQTPTPARFVCPLTADMRSLQGFHGVVGHGRPDAGAEGNATQVCSLFVLSPSPNGSSQALCPTAFCCAAAPRPSPQQTAPTPPPPPHLPSSFIMQDVRPFSIVGTWHTRLCPGHARSMTTPTPWSPPPPPGLGNISGEQGTGMSVPLSTAKNTLPHRPFAPTAHLLSGRTHCPPPPQGRTTPWEIHPVLSRSCRGDHGDPGVCLCKQEGGGNVACGSGVP